MIKAKFIIYGKEFRRYLTVCILFFIAIFLAFWVNTPTYYIKCNFSSEVCMAINNVIMTLSLSYIAGFIFFFVSVFIPDAKKKYNDEYRIAFLLDKLKKDYSSIINFNRSENLQKPSFAEFSNSLFYEDVSKYCNNLVLSDKNGECNINVHFKPEILFALELCVNVVRADIDLLQMLSPKLSFPIIEVLSKIKRSRILDEIEKRRGYRDKFTYDEMEIRFALYKMMMLDFKKIEKELIKEVDKNNIIFPQFN